MPSVALDPSFHPIRQKPTRDIGGGFGCLGALAGAFHRAVSDLQLAQGLLHGALVLCGQRLAPRLAALRPSEC